MAGEASKVHIGPDAIVAILYRLDSFKKPKKKPKGEDDEEEEEGEEEEAAGAEETSLLRKFRWAAPAAKAEAVRKHLSGCGAAPKGKAKPAKKVEKDLSEMEAAEVAAASWFDS